jgi:predicted NBD/HSP70 family sugar kinase
MLGGRLVHGRRSLAEIGHTLIAPYPERPDGPVTVETEGTGAALARIAETMGIAGGPTELERRVRVGDVAATQAWAQVVDVAKLAVANLAHLYSPQVLIVGGGLGLGAGGLLLDPLRDALDLFGRRRRARRGRPVARMLRPCRQRGGRLLPSPDRPWRARDHGAK